MTAEEIKRQYWVSIEPKHKPSAWEFLDASYGAPGRAYHSWAHIAALLGALDRFFALAARPDLIATAIFWHDVVYQTVGADQSRRADCDNVKESAEMFRRYTLLKKADAEAVQELIMASADHLAAKASRERYEGFAQDLDLFVDLDLAPLAVTWDEFARNYEAIRSEFALVPDNIFNRGQMAFLENLMTQQEKLFRRRETTRALRPKALLNISRCLDGLRGAGGVALTTASSLH